MNKYPYIQDKKKITNFQCEICKKQVDTGFRVEWRVNIFQGDCEFENTCNPCISKQLNEIKIANERQEKIAEEREAKYKARMQPKWDRLEKLLAENNITVKKFPATGQWTFNNLIDWWTSTGTAINRKTHRRYRLTVDRPLDIIFYILNP